MLDTSYDNVRVSTVMPGSVATEFGGSAAAAIWDQIGKFIPRTWPRSCGRCCRCQSEPW